MVAWPGEEVETARTEKTRDRTSKEQDSDKRLREKTRSGPAQYCEFRMCRERDITEPGKAGRSEFRREDGPSSVRTGEGPQEGAGVGEWVGLGAETCGGSSVSGHAQLLGSRLCEEREVEGRQEGAAGDLRKAGKA